jgi:tetratricopeptide (TPR) repeat protein
MKTIRTFIAVSREFDAIHKGLLELLGQLNREFRPQGVEFIPTRPRESARDADIAIILYGTDYGEMPRQEFDKAYESFKAVQKPKIYVFFRETEKAVDAAMKAFRDSFADRYGHFYCHFETLDAVRFHVAAQSLAFLPGGEALHPLRVDGTRVCLGDVPVADLGQLPFAKLNQKRRTLLRQLGRAEDEIAELADGADGDADAEEALREARARCGEIREELKRYEEFLLGAALFFAKGSASEWDERTRRARALFERGQAKEANEAIDLKQLLRQDQQDMLVQNQRDSETFRTARETRIKRLNAFWAKSQLVMADYSLPIAERCAQSFTAMEHAIRIAKEVHYDEKETGGMVFFLATVQASQQRYRESVQWYGEALEIFRTLARKESGAMEVVGCVLNNLGSLYQKLGNHQAAEAAGKEALDIMRLQAAKYPEHEATVGSALSNLAVLHLWMKKFREAEREHLEALPLLRKWAAKKPGAYEEKLAAALINYGALLRAVSRFPEAEAPLEEALCICRRRKEAEPDNTIVRERLSRVLLNLAALHRFMNRTDAAEREITEATKLARANAEYNAEAYEWQLANTLQEKAALFRQLERTREAERDLEEVLSIYERIRARQPGAASNDYAASLESLGAIRFAGRRLPEAERAYLRALELFREVARADAAAGLPRVAQVLQALGFLHTNMERMAEAEGEMGEASDIYQRLAMDNPGAFAGKWLEALDMRAAFYVKAGMPAKAEGPLQELLAVVEGMAESRPEAFEAKIADILDKLAGLHLSVQKWAQAENEYARSIALRRNHGGDGSPGELEQCARQNFALAIARSQQGKDSALAPAREAAELYETLSRHQPGRYAQELATCRQIVSQVARIRNSRPQPRPGFFGRLFGAGRTVVCPICGEEHGEKETFRCPKCGRSGLCWEHRDRRTGTCGDCVREERERLEREEAKRREEVKRRERLAAEDREFAARAARVGGPGFFTEPKTPVEKFIGWSCTLLPEDMNIFTAYYITHQAWAEGGRHGPEPEMSEEHLKAWDRILRQAIALVAAHGSASERESVIKQIRAEQKRLSL